MESIHVDTAALGAAARSISEVAAGFGTNPAPAASAPSSQLTPAAVAAVHEAASRAESAMAARLRDTAAAFADGGTAFATTERASADSLAHLGRDHR